MRKRITLLVAALMMALTMSFGGVAFASGSGNNHFVLNANGPGNGGNLNGDCSTVNGTVSGSCNTSNGGGGGGGGGTGGGGGGGHH